MSVPVLLVDDQEPFRGAARAVLSRMEGFEFVGEAATGEEPFDLATTYGSCVHNPTGDPTKPVCLEGDGIPPLPPGRYRAVLVSSSPLPVPVPPAVPVRLTR